MLPLLLMLSSMGSSYKIISIFPTLRLKRVAERKTGLAEREVGKLNYESQMPLWEEDYEALSTDTPMQISIRSRYSSDT